MHPVARAALLLLLLGGPALAQGPGYEDEGDAASLLAALGRQAPFLARAHRTGLHLGDRPVTEDQLRRTHEAFVKLVRACYGTPDFQRELVKRFEFIPCGTLAHFTGYYLPLLEARKAPDERFRFPLYRRPPDLVRADLGAFRPSLAGQTVFGRLEGRQLVPYATRQEIEDGGALAGKGLELAWVADELDRFLLMVQGSGVLRFQDGSQYMANYAGSNGRPYVSLGKLLVEEGKIERDRISIPAIRAYFRAHPCELHAELARNPSYVFFELAQDGPFGVDGIPLTAGRSMATDKALSPSGAIAYLHYPRAKWGSDGTVTGFEEAGGFWCDQDTGGAIKGAGRADLFWGAGERAAAIAGSLNGTGSIALLLLRE